MFRAIRLRKLRFRALPWKAIGVIPDEEIWNRILILATWMDLFGEVSVFRSAVPVCHASAGLKVSFGRLGMRRPKSIIDRATDALSVTKACPQIRLREVAEQTVGDSTSPCFTP